MRKWALTIPIPAAGPVVSLMLTPTRHVANVILAQIANKMANFSHISVAKYLTFASDVRQKKLS